MGGVQESEKPTATVVGLAPLDDVMTFRLSKGVAPKRSLCCWCRFCWCCSPSLSSSPWRASTRSDVSAEVDVAGTYFGLASVMTTLSFSELSGIKWENTTRMFWCRNTRFFPVHTYLRWTA